MLYNLARLYLLDSAYAKGLDVARQLIAVDPSNPDNYQLMVLGYSGIKKDYDAQAQAGRFDSEGVRPEGQHQQERDGRQAAYVDSAARNNKVLTGVRRFVARHGRLGAQVQRR